MTEPYDVTTRADRELGIRRFVDRTGREWTETEDKEKPSNTTRNRKQSQGRWKWRTTGTTRNLFSGNKPLRVSMPLDREETARLIAAAPDLLEASLLMLDVVEHDTAEEEILRVAISKASGTI